MTMLEGQSIVCFAPEPWEGIWRNRHQILSRLALRNTVLWVEPRPYLRQALSRRAGRSSGPRLRHEEHGLHVYRSPRWAPVAGREPLKSLFDALRRRSLLAAMARVGMCQPIVWLCRPWQHDVMGRYNERLLMYHVVDEYAAYEVDYVQRVGHERQQALRAMEQRILREADLVIVTSSPLLEAKRSFNPHTYLVRNGADTAAFAAAVDSAEPPPADIAALPQPVIGIAGVVTEKIDLALLRELAMARPDWSLAFIGPVILRFGQDEMSSMDLPNVHFLGHKPVHLLPRYIAACQVCLMPYRINEWTRHIDPLKMYEYLAAGKPVVSTDIPSAREFSPPVRIAHDAAGFVSAIEEALALSSVAEARALRSLAARHDWNVRVEEISEHIAAALARTQD
jgi:glycosyltransferase involved in cell wall biosynthesis